MNKITSTLAGLAVVATASIVPAFAQGTLTNSPIGGTAPNFSFSVVGGVGTATSLMPVTFNPTVGASTFATFVLKGTQLSPTLFSLTSLSITPTGASSALPTDVGPVLFTEQVLPSGVTYLGSFGVTPTGSSFDLTNPVPEASTVVSFGALLALGGMAVVLRRKGVKNAA